MARLTPLPSSKEPFFVFLGVKEDGKTLVSSPLQASCGSGCRGSYVLDFAAPEGTTGKASLEVYSESAADGSIDQIARRQMQRNRLGAGFIQRQPLQGCTGFHVGQDVGIRHRRTSRWKISRLRFLVPMKPGSDRVSTVRGRASP